MWWRRRRVGGAATTALAQLHSGSLVREVRTETALSVLAVNAAQLEARIERLAGRLDEQEQAQLDLPTHGDLLEVRLHSARVAAEVARVRMELRAELAALGEQAAAPPVMSAREQRLATLAEQIIDLSDAFDTRPGDHYGELDDWRERSA
jgi:acyl transferase domain-containing protein